MVYTGVTKALKEKFELGIKEAGESNGRFIKFSDEEVLEQIESKFQAYLDGAAAEE